MPQTADKKVSHAKRGALFLEEAGKLIQHPCVKPVEHYPVMKITRGHGKIQHEIVPVQNSYRIRHLFVE